MVGQTLAAELVMIMKEDYKIDLSVRTARQVGSDLASYFAILAEIKAETENENENSGDRDY
jgi:hypothetical protein